MNIQADEIEVTQYIRPNGKQKKVYAPVGEEYVEMAEGMVISSEVIPGNKVAIYIRMDYEPEEDESVYIADNEAGDNEPTDVLRRAIREKRREIDNE